MLLLKKYIVSLLFVIAFFSCQTKSSSGSGIKVLHFSDLNNIDYQITDTTLVIKRSGINQEIHYVFLDSSRKGNPDKLRYTIGIESFTPNTPDSLKEVTVLAIGKKTSASEITIVKDKASYDARLISDVSGKGGEVTNLVTENWEFNYILNP